MGEDDWLCVVGVDATTRTQLGVIMLGGKPSFNLQSSDRMNEWGKMPPENAELTGDGYRFFRPRQTQYYLIH